MALSESGRLTIGGATRWKKGQSGNPKGGKKGTGHKLSIKKLAKAIKFVEVEQQETFLIAWLRCSWNDPTAMNNIAHYYLPTRKSIDMTISMEESMSNDYAKELSAAIQSRCELVRKK